MKPTTVRTIPEAPPSVAKHIDALGQLRVEAKRIRSEAATFTKRIIEYGKSCHTEEWNAYISHTSGGFSKSFSPPTTKLILKRRTK